jgi:hypothetical protein
MQGDTLALKTFNLDERVYKQYSAYCKERGISMSKQVEGFISRELVRLKPMPALKNTLDLKEKEGHAMQKFC